MNLNINFSPSVFSGGMRPMSHFGGLQGLMGMQMPGMGFGMPGAIASPQAMLFQMMSRLMSAAMSQGIPNHGSCPCNCQQNGLPMPGWAFPGNQGQVFPQRMPQFFPQPFGQHELPHSHDHGHHHQAHGGHGTGGVLHGHARPARLGAEQITKQLTDGKHGEAFAKMSPEQQKKLINVLQHSQGGKGKLSPSMMKLFGSNKMMAKDKGGHSVLDHMDRLSNSKLQKGVKRGHILRDMAHTLNDYKGWNQDGQGTCTVTAIGREHIRTQPADFVRVSTDLLTAGKTKTAGGDEVHAASGDLGKADKSGRSQLERVYQDAMMEFGNGDATYDAYNDKHSSSGQSGLSSRASAYVSNSVLGRDVSSVRNGSKWLFKKQLGDFTEKGQSMQASLKWSDKGEKHANHMVGVQQVKEGYVYLDNPWGEAKGSLPSGVEAYGEGGQVRMKEADFFKRMNDYQAKDVGFVRRVGRRVGANIDNATEAIGSVFSS